LVLITWYASRPQKKKSQNFSGGLKPFCAKGSMDGNGKGTDIFVGYMWEAANHTLVPHVNDYWTTTRDLPQKDSKSVTLLSYLQAT